MSIRIVNDRIKGTRITVFSVYHYLVHGWSPPEICQALSISPEELQAALRFIEENRAYVEQVDQQIEERNRRGNPPELQARLDAGHEAFLKRVKERQEQRLTERNGEGNPLRQ